MWQKMVIKLGRYGRFLSCSDFPDCKGIKSLEEDITLDDEKYYFPEQCPKCKSKMMLKTGKYGRFWACENYPECKSTLPMLLKEECPECGNHLVERRSRWGQIFIGCSNYPDCKYIQKKKKEDKSKDEED